MPYVKRRRVYGKKVSPYKSKSKAMLSRRPKARLPGYVTGSSIMTMSGGAIFPARLNFKGMKYSADVIMSSGSAGGASATPVVFQLNNLRAPQSTGGHQPYGFDQVSGLYVEYLVTGIRITIKCFAASAQHVQPVWLIQRSNSTFNIAGLYADNISERPLGFRGITQLSGPNVMHWSMYVTPWGIDGVRRPMFGDANSYAGNTSSGNPNDMVQLWIAAADQNQNAGTSVTFNVTLEYDGYFFGRTSQTQS